MFSLLIDKLPFFTAIFNTPKFIYILAGTPASLLKEYNNTKETKSQYKISTLSKRVLTIFASYIYSMLFRDSTISILLSLKYITPLIRREKSTVSARLYK